MDACPEPYLSYNADITSEDVLIFLTTNPGDSGAYQLFKNINSDISFIDINKTYKDNSIEFAEYYKKNLVGPAKDRVTHMYQFAKALGYEGFIQIETIPFHSKDLDKKNIEQIICDSSILTEYTNLIKKAIKDKNVIILDGSHPTNIDIITEWSKYKCNMIELDLNNSEKIELVNNGERTTVMAYANIDNNIIKGLCLRIGLNDLPSKDNQIPLINFIKNNISK